MSSDSTNFYADLEGFANFARFADSTRYASLPDDWWVVVTDVADSTQAIENGLYKQVNSVGVASIVATINAAQPVEIPYVFGGDGAILLVPGTVLKQVRSALIATHQMARSRFQFHLRIGLTRMGDIRDAGHEIRVAKYQPSPDFHQATLLGSGVAYAEKRTKNGDNTDWQQRERGSDNPALSASVFSGFECRWKEVPSPHEANISLIVKAASEDDVVASCTYNKVLDEIRRIYGEESMYQPLTENELQLSTSAADLSDEAAIKTSFKSSWIRYPYLLYLQGISLLGNWLMSSGGQTRETDWSQYKTTLIAHTDFRKFDHAFRTVISGSKAQHRELRLFLETLREAEEAHYGLHSAASALITCMVSDYHQQHVHFLDTANGGYASACRELKKQLEAP